MEKYRTCSNFPLDYVSHEWTSFLRVRFDGTQMQMRTFKFNCLTKFRLKTSLDMTIGTRIKNNYLLSIDLAFYGALDRFDLYHKSVSFMKRSLKM